MKKGGVRWHFLSIFGLNYMDKNTLPLEERLDLSTANLLADAILKHANTDLDLNAGAVTHLGAMGVQVIRCAAQSWAKSGHNLQITGLSQTCEQQLELLGFTSDTLCIWEETA